MYLGWVRGLAQHSLSPQSRRPAPPETTLS